MGGFLCTNLYVCKYAVHQLGEGVRNEFDCFSISRTIEVLCAQMESVYLKGTEVFENPLNYCRWAGDKQIKMMRISTLKEARVRYHRP